MKFYQLFQLVCCIASVCQALEIPEHLKKHAERLHNLCRDLTNTDEDLISQSKNGFLPDDQNLKCYINCLFDKSGLIDQHGILHLEHLLDILPTEHKELLEKVLPKCETIHGVNACETAWLTVKCYFEADPENSMLI